MKKRAHTLAKEYDFNSEHEFYDYIVNSLINGNRQQVKELFNSMHKDSQQDFLINYLDVKIGYHKSTLNICIGELCK